MEYKITSRNPVCPACGGKEICYGYIGSAASVFIPSNLFTIHGYRLRSYVCMKCGQLTQYIPADRLEKLREKFEDRFGKS